MAAFSAALKLADLNDFIAPSQACVVSLEGSKQSGAPERQAEVGVHVNKRSKGFQQTEQANAGDPIKVTLHDCLACSGCVTSAETVLLQHQSGSELLAKLADPQTAVVSEAWRLITAPPIASGRELTYPFRSPTGHHAVAPVNRVIRCLLRHAAPGDRRQAGILLPLARRSAGV